ncbi:heat-inducible transcriptional repressor HrcA [Neglectibacter caecimuris]|uniref:heat-inducible transcriptional repressor HrcA n=1 Tax=Neglectibacter caecimuris TaxID=3093658 RepID=UPI002AC991F9|nr:heat-inducible transcriptional repressor HrcA [Neglectibacter sp. M00184]
MEMTPRKEKILSSVVRDFVKSGEPVGSKAIAEEIGVSSATVRNEMAELIELGLLEQPHTSAGRIPSQRGYREYVDHLMRVPVLREEEERWFTSMLAGSAYEPERLLLSVCRLLSSVTRYAAAVTTPSGMTARVKAVQFVQTSRRTAMLLLMSSAGTMKTRVFHCDFDLSGEILRVLFRLFNEKVTGKEVLEITPAFLQSMGASLGEMMVLAGSALQALLEAARDTAKTEVLTSGQMDLLLYPELEHRQIMDFLERKEDVVSLLRQKPGRVSILIGSESQRPELKNASFLISRYAVEEQDVGALALLGPTRMDYARLTAILQYLTKEVGQMLTVLTREE